MMRPLLSICIPTYNRAKMLDETLSHYSHGNAEVDEQVEIVISDNCSTDDTEPVVRRHMALCPRIRYFQNDVNVTDLNFIYALNRGEGEYLKLVNDCYYLDASALRFVKGRLSESRKNRLPVFFTNDWLFTEGRQSVMHCADLDEYVRRVSTFVTCIAVFGAWCDQWHELQDKDRYRHLKLMQDDWTYQLVAARGCVIYNQRIFGEAKMQDAVRGGYNWFQVHLDNYYRILEPYHSRGQVSEATLKRDRRHLLWHFVPELCQIYIWHGCPRWQYETDGTLRLLWRYCRWDWYFYYLFLTLPLRWLRFSSVRDFKCY